jgi:hypothetical protein
MSLLPEDEKRQLATLKELLIEHVVHCNPRFSLTEDGMSYPRGRISSKVPS